MGRQHHYQDPAKHSCLPDEDTEDVPLQGVLERGVFCSPRCATNQCPVDVPANVSATPLCVISSNATAMFEQDADGLPRWHSTVETATHCALVCLGGLQCPAGASCTLLGDTAICT